MLSSQRELLNFTFTQQGVIFVYKVSEDLRIYGIGWNEVLIKVSPC